MSLALLGTASTSFGQTIEKRLDDAIAEITILKRVIAEQDRRISDLEKAILSLQSSAVPGREQTGALEKSSGPQSSKPAWHNNAVWERVEDGMSESQVVALLGKPTSVESGVIRTLFFRGEVPGSGFVSGNVQLFNDRVLLVNKPVF